MVVCFLYLPRRMEEYITLQKLFNKVAFDLQPPQPLLGSSLLRRRMGASLCINYWGLNKVTIKNRHAAPSSLNGTQLSFPGQHLDQTGPMQSLNLVHIRELDKRKTAFITNNGQWEYLVMPFGLFNSPAIFQQMPVGVCPIWMTF